MSALLSRAVYGCLLARLSAVFFPTLVSCSTGSACLCLVLLYSAHLLDNSAIPSLCSLLFWTLWSLSSLGKKTAQPRLPTDAFISGLGASLISYPTPSHDRFLHSSPHELIHRWWLLEYVRQTPGLIIMTPCEWISRSPLLVGCQRNTQKKRGGKKNLISYLGSVCLYYLKGILFGNVERLRSEVKVWLCSCCRPEVVNCDDTGKEISSFFPTLSDASHLSR